MKKAALLSAFAVAILLTGCVHRAEKPLASSASPPRPAPIAAVTQTASLTGFSSAMQPIEVLPQRISCVPYARAISGFELRGDAWTWWKGAESIYERGSTPEVGAIIVMSKSKTMGRGHVGVVTRILNSREIQIDHANWRRGEVHRGALVRDVSAANDWSEVQVWYPPINGYGTGRHKLSGFIYPRHI